MPILALFSAQGWVATALTGPGQGPLNQAVFRSQPRHDLNLNLNLIVLPVIDGETKRS